MERLVDLFPVLVVAATVVVLILALRLDRRLGRGAYSAGPLEPEPATPAGVERTPWELKAIDDQLMLASGIGGATVPRYDLTATVNRLIAAAGLPPHDELPVSAELNELAAAITLIEQRLGLPPLIDSQPTESNRVP
jgi:hypothetical protein